MNHLKHTTYVHALLLFAVIILGCDQAVQIGAEELSGGLTGNTSTMPPAYHTGLDSSLVSQAVEEAASLDRLHALIIARHGEIQVEERFNGGPGLDQPVNVKSVSKSILSAVAGIAIEEGILEGVEQQIAPFFAAYLTEEDDPRKEEITVGHLLSMQSGLERTSGSNYGRWVTSSNWIRHAITRDLLSAPGTERDYSTGNSHLLSAVITQASGESTWSYAQSRLAEPLGIRLPPWPTDPQGIYFGGNDMLVSPRGLVRFGEMYRNVGRLDGKQIVPDWWVRESFKPRAESRWSGAGYGYGWFSTQIRGHAMYYGWGYGGQYLFIIPGLEMTVVATSDPYNSGGGNHRRQIQQILTDLIVPAAENGSSHQTD